MVNISHIYISHLITSVNHCGFPSPSARSFSGTKGISSRIVAVSVLGMALSDEVSALERGWRF